MNIDKLDELVNKSNNTYHNTINLKPADVRDNVYINCTKKIHNENRKFKVGDHLRVSKYKKFLQKFTPQIGLKKFL